MLRRLKKEATEEDPIQPRKIQQVNDAYELLKSDLEDTFEVCRQVKEPVDTSCHATALTCSPECVYALGMCSSPNSRWKSEMEDTKIYQDCFGENKDKCYLGLFDGYHGRFSAEVAASLLHKMLLHELMKIDSSLMLGPKQGYEAETDISHHSFVFGLGATLDGQSGIQSNKENPAWSKTGQDTVPMTIQPDDDDLTQRIIQLCEHKYEKLLEEMSSPLPSKTSQSLTGRTDRPRHPMEEQIAQAFNKSYQLLDILLSYGKDEWSKVRWSGCSALSLVIESSQQSGESANPSAGGQGDDKQKRAESKLAEPPQEKGFIHLANAGRCYLLAGTRGVKAVFCQ